MEKAKKSLERKHKQEEMATKAIANATQKSTALIGLPLHCAL